MIITNKLNLPEPIIRAIEANWYSGSGENRFASVTELIKPTKQFVLTKRHYDEIVQDATDMIWMLMGSAIHKVVEAADIPDSLCEERLGVNIDGNIITGGIDLYKDGVITDFKFTSVWNHLHGSRKEEWEKQLNLYAFLLNQNGHEVKAINVIAIFRDWQKSKSLVDYGYPQQIETIELELWDQDRTLALIEERVQDIKANMELPDDMIPECSRRERWQSEPKYAVYKEDGKRALRVFETKEEAEDFKQEHKDKDKLSIQTRNDLPKRCMEYCPVSSFCHYYQEINQPSASKAA